MWKKFITGANLRTLGGKKGGKLGKNAEFGHFLHMNSAYLMQIEKKLQRLIPDMFGWCKVSNSHY